MRIKEISHIAIAVKDLTSAVKFFKEKFGFEIVHRTTGGGLHVAFLRGGATPLELLQDELPGGTMEKFIEKRGEGIHHLCFEVKDIRVAMQELQTAGVRLLDKEPRQGARDALVAFIHPRDSYGVLIELAQYEGRPGTNMKEKDFSVEEE